MEGNKVVGYADQNHVKICFELGIMIKDYQKSLQVQILTDSYNYTKSYSVVNGSNSLDSRGAAVYIAKNIEVTLYYPEGMEFVNVVNNAGTVLKENSNVTITNYQVKIKLSLIIST
ncbi:hypothetical protein GCM10027614_85000 [Micromonospora vulcania]